MASKTYDGINSATADRGIFPTLQKRSMKSNIFTTSPGRLATLPAARGRRHKIWKNRECGGMIRLTLIGLEDVLQRRTNKLAQICQQLPCVRWMELLDYSPNAHDERHAIKRKLVLSPDKGPELGVVLHFTHVCDDKNQDQHRKAFNRFCDGVYFSERIAHAARLCKAHPKILRLIMCLMQETFVYLEKLIQLTEQGIRFLGVRFCVRRSVVLPHVIQNRCVHGGQRLIQEVGIPSA